MLFTSHFLLFTLYLLDRILHFVRNDRIFFRENPRDDDPPCLSSSSLSLIGMCLQPRIRACFLIFFLLVSCSSSNPKEEGEAEAKNET
jgi:hypothetical protein